MNQIIESSQTRPKSPIAALISIAILSILAFIVVAYFVTEGSTINADKAVLIWINQTTNPAFDAFFVTITEAGGVIVLGLFSVLLFIYMLAKKKYLKATLVAAGIGGAALLNVILKSTFDRPRPDLWEWLVVESNFSFPSGHATASMALALVLIALAWKTHYRGAVIAGAAFYVLVIAYSRLYLGVHYPTDIVAGWLTSIAWFALLIASMYVYRHRKVVSDDQEMTEEE